MLPCGVRGNSPSVDEGEWAQAARRAARPINERVRKQAIIETFLELVQKRGELYPSPASGAMLRALIGLQCAFYLFLEVCA